MWLVQNSDKSEPERFRREYSTVHHERHRHQREQAPLVWVRWVGFLLFDLEMIMKDEERPPSYSNGDHVTTASNQGETKNERWWFSLVSDGHIFLSRTSANTWPIKIVFNRNLSSLINKFTIKSRTVSQEQHVGGGDGSHWPVDEEELLQLNSSHSQDAQQGGKIIHQNKIN